MVGRGEGTLTGADTSKEMAMTAQTYQQQQQTIAERVLVLRRRQRIEQNDLSRRINRGRNFVNRLENYRADAGLEDVWELARELGTTQEYLLGYTDDPSGPANVGSDGGAIPGYLDVDPFLVPS